MASETEIISMGKLARAAVTNETLVRIASTRSITIGGRTMDGRDIGTVVLPDADLKVFLTASSEARAARRCLELEQRGTPQPYHQVLSEIQQRDWNDTHREIAPLRRAEDAVELDTTELDFEQSLAALLTLVREVAGQ